MNETDKKRLEEIQAELHAIDHGAAASRMNDDRTDEDTRWLISHLKDAMERESRVRELHKAYPEWGGDNEGEPTAFCIVCCEDIASALEDPNFADEDDDDD